MIAKVITGKSFGGCVRYLLERDEARVIDAVGVRDYDSKAIIADLNAQRKLRPELGNAVGHIVLSWSNEDRDKLTDEKMKAHAKEYMEKMGIKNTQYVTVLHTDKKHPHVHIVYNRVDNEGETISNYNHWHKSNQVCKEMTKKHGYYFGKGKEQVNRQNLRGNDKLRYAIHDAIKSALLKASTWKQLETILKAKGVSIHYKYRSGTEEVQGISFEMEDVKFKGSAIDRKYSFAGITAQLNKNLQAEQESLQGASDSIQPSIQDNDASWYVIEQGGWGYDESSSWSLFGALIPDADLPYVTEPETLTEAEKRRRRKKRIAQSKGRTR